jgi:mRNA-degrading endonuclease toxin of MazEF toxin-antitoxin module
MVRVAPIVDPARASFIPETRIELRARRTSEVTVGTESGLKQVSAINLHHLATVPLAGLRTFVGSLPSQAMTRVREALLFSLGFIEPQG